MEADKLKQKIRQTLTQNPDKKITPAELEDVMIDMVDNQPSQESVIKKELFFDDGSGEVVPVKHPDLSTQPSILPYKFAGNYVYEQMVWVDGEKFSDSNINEIDLIKFQDYKLDAKSTVLIDHHVFIVTSGHYGNYTPLPYDDSLRFNIASNDKRIFLKRSGTFSLTCKGAWIRVVWTSEPKAGGYYYYASEEEQGITFVNNLSYPIMIKTGRTTLSLGVQSEMIGTLSYSTPELSIFLNESDTMIIRCDQNPDIHSNIKVFVEGVHVMTQRRIPLPFSMDLQTGDSSHGTSNLQTECPELYNAIKNGKNVEFHINNI